MTAIVNIRKAEPKDSPHFRDSIAKAKVLGNSAPLFYFRWVIREGIALIAEKGRKKVGFLIAERNDKIAYAQLIYLFVHPKFRNKGIGGLLMNHFLRTCQQKGVKYMDLHAPTGVAGFYKQFRFKEEGKFVALYREWR